MKPLLSFKTLRAAFVIAAITLLSACATTPDPSSAGNVSFGAFPDDYKNVVLDYMKKKRMRTPLNLDKTEFLNEPNKFIFDQMTNEQFGYRVCAIIPTKSAYEFRKHFFLINDGKVTAHLHDAGLISLSTKFCNVEMLALEKRASNVAAAPATAPVDEYGFKYITCQTGSDEVFFAFNPEKQQLIQQAEGNNVAQFDITDLTDTFIVAEKEAHRISINRVSGTLIHRHQDSESTASCELSSQQKF